MNISEMRLPRQLEADGSDETIRGELLARTSKLWTGGEIDVPVITLSEPMKAALKQARLQGRIRFGFEPILQKLAGEKKGFLMSGSRQMPPMETGFRDCFYFPMMARSVSIAMSNRSCRCTRPDCWAIFWILTAQPWVSCLRVREDQ